MDLTKNVNEIITDMANAIDNLKGQILQAVYPIGTVYVSITDSRNPADILGFGTWEALPAGYGLVAQGTATAEDGSTLTFTAGEKIGEFKHQITVGELPKIKGTFGCAVPFYHTTFANGVFHGTDFGDKLGSITDGSERNGTVFGYCIEFGSNQYHNNVSPCISAYMWKRVD